MFVMCQIAIYILTYKSNRKNQEETEH